MATACQTVPSNAVLGCSGTCSCMKASKIKIAPIQNLIICVLDIMSTAMDIGVLKIALKPRMDMSVDATVDTLWEETTSLVWMWMSVQTAAATAVNRAVITRLEVIPVHVRQATSCRLMEDHVTKVS
jgi:hypothetical protein